MSARFGTSGEGEHYLDTPTGVAAPHFDGSRLPVERTIAPADAGGELTLAIELGRLEITRRQLLDLRPGMVVPLDKLAGDPVDVFVNGRLVARGEVLVLNDNFCVRVTELLTGDDFD